MASPSSAFIPSAPLSSHPRRSILRHSVLHTSFLTAPPKSNSNSPHPTRRSASISATASEPAATPAPSSSTPSPTDATTATRESPPTDTVHSVRHLFRRHDHVSPKTARAVAAVFAGDAGGVVVEEETCFNVGLSGPLSPDMEKALHWLLAETWQPHLLTSEPHLSPVAAADDVVIEVGPRLNFQTAWSSNAVSICHACSIPVVTRLERSRRYRITTSTPSTVSLTQHKLATLIARLHDRMTETVYHERLTSFSVAAVGAPSFDVDVLSGGRDALRAVSEREGLGFDTQDIEYYYQLFVHDMKRNPTNVELFDLAQSNSEHSRHWFFKGKLVVDGETSEKHLFDMVRDTLHARQAMEEPDNSVIAFADNSSSIRGGVVDTLVPTVAGMAAPLTVRPRDRDIVFTAETHNFPSGVAPFPGAETGTGGRIRDTAATGTGSLVGSGTAGYAIGHLHIPGHPTPWETTAHGEGDGKVFQYPSNLSSPLDILLGASDGASDYGNKFGEPVINGFARTFGIRGGDGMRREYVKPIMFSGGLGQMEHIHARKGAADIGLLVIKVGGPAYRIGMGGGAASSMMQGDNRDELDFNAVQRGDAEMAQKVVRVLRACVELGEYNPIVSIHDQGAGGNCNVVKELIFPGGARIDVRRVVVGDASLSALEIWGAEYQEQFGLLLRPEHEALFTAMCERENVTPAVLGSVDGSGRITLWDEVEEKNVVDLDLDAVLGDLPQKTFVDSRMDPKQTIIPLPFSSSSSSSSTDHIDITDMLRRVVTLMTVGSKRFLTTKVDRSVTGLVAQQQCVGPLQLPLCGFAVTAQSHMSLAGAATAIGERPSLTMLDPAAMARMSVAEMLTNLCGAAVTSRLDVKCEANWMWAAKLPGDCASLLDAVSAMRDALISLGVAVDGGKDSLSMAARCPGEAEHGDALVRAPGTLVMSGYVTMKDIRRKLTPDLKNAGGSCVLHVDVAAGRRRLGGSCLAYTHGATGETCPDLDDAAVLAKAFDHVQSLLLAKHQGDKDGKKKLSSPLLAYHDVSDGGLIVALLEMAFAGNVGLDIAVESARLHDGCTTVEALFAEEVGMLLEVPSHETTQVISGFTDIGVLCSVVATTRSDYGLTVRDNGRDVLPPGGDIRHWRNVWEETSFALEAQQAAAHCVQAERTGLKTRTGPVYKVPFTPTALPQTVADAAAAAAAAAEEVGNDDDGDDDSAAEAEVHVAPSVAIVREEGSNGDREMSAAFHLAGFRVWDVCTRDIASGNVQLSGFQGVAFVGGFSFADVLDSAKGWAGVTRMNGVVKKELEAFFARDDTFSLGVCNGCQLMTLMGRVPGSLDEEVRRPRFVQNESGRYESRFSTVTIVDSAAIMLRGMGGATLGVWVAHGEGRAYFPDEEVANQVVNEGLAPIRFVDDAGRVTEEYPCNPNGSRQGVAGLCSRDGRHLAMMPHPERAVQLWQWGYVTEEVSRGRVSPWLKMFQNAYDWAVRAREEQMKQ